ncbi:bestrophin-like domain [Paraburkholderia susongensis]|uniref:DUF4239 domain-containing protein n=1 Tax=Paraburkholderia susongensis TaxID=1515439 RepID=A0A1X7LWN8_9BURK|nr:hypothetical protein [Paraburkholderia susongensis]SMG57924.1 hypothetical protein SAMN06265784_110125 [Paraburkholderia susongensis]
MKALLLVDLADFTLHSWHLFLISLIVLWSTSYIGATVFTRIRKPQASENEDVRMILGATLTLLGLTIGFTLSMAIGGYNSRQSNEAAEAVAITTALDRADLLQDGQATTLRPLLAQYLDERLSFYRTHDRAQLTALGKETAALKRELWDTVVRSARAQPTPLAALAVAAMSDVLTSETNTQAGWRNQIPLAAWGLMAVIAACCNLLVGYCAGRKKHGALLFMLPFVIAVSFTLIGDIDVPGRGVIRVSPVNLERIVDILHATNMSG